MRGAPRQRQAREAPAATFCSDSSAGVAEPSITGMSSACARTSARSRAE
jgi:hypothetical protein